MGNIFERRAGSRLTIQYFTPGCAHYCLAKGSNSQFRSIRLERLHTPSYKLVGWEEME